MKTKKRFEMMHTFEPQGFNLTGFVHDQSSILKL